MQFKINNSMKGLIIFGGGFALGFGICFIALKEYFRSKAEEEIEDVKAAFADQLGIVEQERDDALGMARSSIIESGKYVGNSDILSDKSSTAGIVGAYAIRKSEDIVDYTTYFKTSDSQSVKLDELDHSGDHPEDDEPENDPIFRSDGVLEYPNGDTVNTVKINKRPRIIKAEDYGEYPDYECSILYFYAMDKVLITENGGDIIDDPESIIGDALTKYGFENNAEMRIYVRNDEFDTDYEIIKVMSSYAD